MHCRLDGAVRLRRQRHVHADINLAWRIPEQPPETRLFTPLEKITYLTHHLDESRAIRSNRFEYFDSGWLGVLLHVTPWLAPEEEDENRSEEHTSELQSRGHLVCRLLLEKKNSE